MTWASVGHFADRVLGGGGQLAAQLDKKSQNNETAGSPVAAGRGAQQRVAITKAEPHAGAQQAADLRYVKGNTGFVRCDARTTPTVFL